MIDTFLFIKCFDYVYTIHKSFVWIHHKDNINKEVWVFKTKGGWLKVKIANSKDTKFITILKTKEAYYAREKVDEILLGVKEI